MRNKFSRSFAWKVFLDRVSTPTNVDANMDRFCALCIVGTANPDDTRTSFVQFLLSARAGDRIKRFGPKIGIISWKIFLKISWNGLNFVKNKETLLSRNVTNFLGKFREIQTKNFAPSYRNPAYEILGTTLSEYTFRIVNCVASEQELNASNCLQLKTNCCLYFQGLKYSLIPTQLRGNLIIEKFFN
jgi:hypothetical protein